MDYLLVSAVLLAGLSSLLLYRARGGGWKLSITLGLRRIRLFRRRVLAPARAELLRVVRSAWRRPFGRSLIAEIRRVADRLERTHRSTAAFARAVAGLESVARRLPDADRLERIREASRGPGGPPPGAVRPFGRAPSGPPPGRGLLEAGILLLAAATLAAVNGWLLYRYALPALPPPLVASARLPAWVVAAVLAVLPVLLGLCRFALAGPRRPLAHRALATVVLVGIIALAALHAGAALLALEPVVTAAPSPLVAWIGLGLSATAATLLPLLVAALAHTAADQAQRWIDTRQRLSMRREVAALEEMDERMRRLTADMSTSLAGFRDELTALGAEPGGRLLLRPAVGPGVEPLPAALRRAARTLQQGDDGDAPALLPPAAALGRILADFVWLVIWVAAAGGALAASAPVLLRTPATSLPPVVTGGAWAGVMAVLLSGLLVRLVAEARGLSLTTLRHGPLLVVLAGAAVVLSFGIGSLTTGVGAGVGALAASAWLFVLVLAGAGASLRLPEGITAAGSLVTLTAAGAALAILAVMEGALAVVDGALLGVRRVLPARRRRRASDILLVWGPDDEAPRPASARLPSAVDAPTTARTGRTSWTSITPGAPAGPGPQAPSGPAGEPAPAPGGPGSSRPSGSGGRPGPGQGDPGRTAAGDPPGDSGRAAAIGRDS